VAEDNPLPSSAARLARVDWRLSVALAEPKRAQAAAKTANHLLGKLGGASLFSAESMVLFKEISSGQIEVVYAFKPDEERRLEWLREGITSQWGVVRIPLGSGLIDPILTEGRLPANETRAYVCVDKNCLLPSSSPGEVRSRLLDLKKSSGNAAPKS